LSGGNTRRIATNTAWLFSEKVVGRLITFLLMVVLARALGTTGFGKLNFANSFAALFIVLADMGIGTLITRDMAARRDDAAEYFGKSIVFTAPLVALAALVIVTAAFVANVPEDTFYLILLFAGYHLLKNLGAVYSSVFKAFERMQYIAGILLAERVLLLGFCLLALQSSNILIGVGIAYFAAGALFLLLAVALVHARFIVPEYRINPEHFKYLARQGFPLAVVAVVSVLYYNVDMIMLGKLRGEASVGVYGAAYRLFFTLATFFNPLLTAVFPTMSRLYEETDGARLGRAYSTSTKLLLGVSVPMVVGGALLSEGIIDFIYGADFAAAAPVFRWFALIIVVAYLNSANSYFLTSIKRQRVIAKAVGVTVAINLALNWVLIPTYGAFGAVWATMVSEVLLVSITFAAIPAEFRRFPIAAVGKSLVVVAGMGAVVYFLQLMGVRLLLTIAVGAVVYIGGLLLVGYLDDVEIDRLKSAIGKRSSEA